MKATVIAGTIALMTMAGSTVAEQPPMLDDVEMDAVTAGTHNEARLKVIAEALSRAPETTSKLVLERLTNAGH